MGMDVFGNKPKDQSGEYFRANVWYWHPLWDCLEKLHPNICGKCESPHDNSGDGLNAKDSFTLSKLLLKDIEDGTIAKYIEEYYEYLSSLPLEDCEYCDKLGVRTWQQENGESITKQCNVCHGSLKVKHFLTNYHMDLELMKEFQTFLSNCGGFKIC